MPSPKALFSFITATVVILPTSQIHAVNTLKPLYFTLTDRTRGILIVGNELFPALHVIWMPARTHDPPMLGLAGKMVEAYGTVRHVGKSLRSLA